MKAIVQGSYGSADVLELRDVDRPEIAEDEVLVAVQAAGVDRGVWHLMTGLPYPIRLAGYGLRAPKNPVPGADLAGVVGRSGRDGSGPAMRCSVSARALTLSTPALCRTSWRPSREPHLRTGGVSPSPACRPCKACATTGGSSRTSSVDHRCVRGGDLRRTGCWAFGAQVTGVCSTMKVDLVNPRRRARHRLHEDFADGPQRTDDLDMAGAAGSLRRALNPRGTPSSPAERRAASGGLRSPAPGAAAVPVRDPDADHIHLQRESCGPARPQTAHRSREGHTGHRPDLRTKRGPAGHPVRAARARPWKGRHHYLTRGHRRAD